MPTPFEDRYYIVFVSSTTDMQEERRLARAALLDKWYLPVGMEGIPSDPKPPKHKIEEFILKSDAVLLLLGTRYGSIPPDEKISYVEWEYNVAREAKKPIFALISEKIKKREDEAEQRRLVDLVNGQQISNWFHDPKSFLLALNRSIDNISRSADDRGGLVRRAEAREAIEISNRLIDSVQSDLQSANEQISRLKAQIGWSQRCRQLGFRIAGAVAQLHSHNPPHLHKSEEKTMNRLNQHNDSLRKLIAVITSEWHEHTILVDIVSAKLDDLTDQLHGLIDEQGYLPRDIEELRTIIDRLFAPTLVELRATSIHSRREELRACNSYWDHKDLGPFFDKKNKTFLLAGGVVQRVYICDSLVDAVAEPWFKDMALQQLRIGAQVKVVKIEEQNAGAYEDFGVYKHRTDGAVLSSYVLCAPRKLNAPGGPLRTSLISWAGSNYETAFEELWSSSPESLALIETGNIAHVASRPLEEFQAARVNDMFSNAILLRNMARLDTKEKLIRDDDRFPRKYEESYSQALGKHIRSHYSGVNQIIYVGDTHMNDASVIRNLQRQGLQATGFICEPELRIKNLWFNGIYYSDAWTDILGYLNRIDAGALGPKTLGIFDIDQTIWAPKGVLEAPLTATRTAAMHMLISKYVDAGRDPFILRTRRLVTSIYRIIKGIAFNVLTQDNEDYKAVVSICLALNLYKARDKEFSVLRAEMLYEDLGYEVDRILKPYMLENGIAEFVGDVFAELDSPEVEQYASENGIRLPELRTDIRDIFRNIRARKPTPYTAFRCEEFEQAMLRAGRGEFDKGERIVLNKTIWDVLVWLRDKNVKLLALSDRPDEATYRGAESLLDCPMCVYGRPIELELAQIAVK